MNKCLRIVLALPLFFLFSSTALAADWTTFRGNPEHSGVSTETINVPMEKKWDYDIGGSYYSSPIVAGGKVYVGSDNGSIYAVPAVAGGAPTWSFPTGSSIESSPLFYNNVVYAGSTDGKLYALNASTGVKAWEYDTNPNGGGPVSSSPVTDGTNIYFATQSGRVFALSASSGAFVWGYDIADTVFRSSTALVLSKQYNALFIGSENGTVYAINTNGTTKWTYATTDDKFDSSSPAVVGGVVYIGSNNGMVYAITANNGSLSWSYNTGTNVDILGSPAVTSSALYIGSISGNFYAIGTSGGNRGNLLWSYNVGGGADIKSSPVVSGNTVFIGANKLFFALNATTGDFKWSYGVGQDVASPAISNGILYIASDKLYALESTTTLVAMIEKWKYNTNSTISMSGVAVDAGVTYIGADDGKLYAINTDGTLRWQYSTGGRITTTPVISSGTVYFGSENKTFYAVNTSDGSLKWTKALGNYYGVYVSSTPVVSGSVVYFGARDGKLYALNTSNGSEVWIPYQANGGTPGEYNLSTPIIDGGKIYFTYAYKAMVALDQATGSFIRETLFEGGGGGSPFAANSILLVNNTLFAGMDRRIYALNLDGTVKWSTYISGGADRGFVNYGDYLVGAGGSGNVYGLNINDGTVIWEYTVKGPPGIPFLWQDVVFIMTSAYRVYAINVENGLLRFEYAGNFAPLAPVVTGGILYLGGRDGRIYAEDIDHYSMAMTRTLGGTILTVYGDTLQIPPNALAGNTTVTITVAPNDQSGEGIVALPRKYQFGPNGTTFSPPATAKFAYKTSDLQGADPNTVKVYVWDSNTSTWTASGGTADLANKTIDVSLTHFSDYALFSGQPDLNFPIFAASYPYATKVTFNFSAFNPEVTNVKGYLNGQEIESGTEIKLKDIGENTFRVEGMKGGSKVEQSISFTVAKRVDLK